jgi:bifunctional DNA-binding transcriptional regulator/antitoxin component of YhaV-PrlF toxin-antitoxin module
MRGPGLARISKGGQISLPASVRRRWRTDRVWIEDKGNAVVVRPLPADPISAARGSLHLPKGLTSDRLRETARAEEDQIEAAQTTSA